jgi:hypothetical protein
VEHDVARAHAEDDAHSDAAIAWGRVAAFYSSDGKFPQAALAMRDAAVARVRAEEFRAAFAAFDGAARLVVDDNLQKFTSPTLRLSAVLALLAELDLEAAAAYLDGQGDDAVFQRSRERRFAQDVVACCEAADDHGFVDHVWNYDYVCALEPVQLQMLEVVLRGIRDSRPEPVVELTADETREVRIQEYLADSEGSDSSWGSESEKGDSDDDEGGGAGAGAGEGEGEGETPRGSPAVAAAAAPGRASARKATGRTSGRTGATGRSTGRG